MIGQLLQGLMSLIIGLINLILLPIDTLILSVLPDLSHALSSFGDFLDLVSTHLGWAISFSGLSTNAISLIIMFYGFKLTAPLLFYTIKLALKWYNSLKP